MIQPSRWWIQALASAAVLAGCGGGAEPGASDAGSTTEFASAVSPSFAPTTAITRAQPAEAAALRWTYMADSSQAVSAQYRGLRLNASISPVVVSFRAGDRTRTTSQQATLSGAGSGVGFSGTLRTTLADVLAVDQGKTVIVQSAFTLGLDLAAGSEHGAVQLNMVSGNFAPPYEWFPDRADLDGLPLGKTVSVRSDGRTSVTLNVSGEPSLRLDGVPASFGDHWTVVEKRPTMTVRGKTYTNVVRLDLSTQVPDVDGHLVPTTMVYWMAKGIGMIRGVGVFPLLGNEGVVYELVETNLTQP